MNVLVGKIKDFCHWVFCWSCGQWFGKHDYVTLHPDGRTDNTLALQTQINSGGFIYLPPGLYKSGPLTLPAPGQQMTLFGEGPDKTIIYRDE